MLIGLTPHTSMVSMGDMKQTVYRKCACGETAHDAKYQIAERRIVWACRNCGALARDRKGQIKHIESGPAVRGMRSYAEHDRGVGGDDPQTDKGG